MPPHAPQRAYSAGIGPACRQAGCPPYFTPDFSRQDVLLTAIGMEKQTILFYDALKGIVPDAATRQALDDIIREERRHVSDLVRALGPNL